MKFARSDDTDTEELSIPNNKLGVDDSTPRYKSNSEQLESVDLSEALENTASLEAPKVRYITVPNLPPPASAIDERSQSIAETVTRPAIPATAKPSENRLDQPDRPDEIVIPLWDERLVMGRNNRKVGEVVVRKEIETQIVEIPIRRERLIVEQVNPEYQQIAVVELGQVQVQGFTDIPHPTAIETPAYPIVSGEFATASSAIQFLEAIANGSHSSLQNIKISIALKEVEQQSTYQKWIELYSTNSTV